MATEQLYKGSGTSSPVYPKTEAAGVTLANGTTVEAALADLDETYAKIEDLPGTASTSEAGTIIVGNGLAINPEGVLSTTNNGTVTSVNGISPTVGAVTLPVHIIAKDRETVELTATPMTSVNTPEGRTVSQSSSQEGEDSTHLGWLAFDGDSSTGWIAGSNGSQWVEYATTTKWYDLVKVSILAYDADRAPLNLTVSVSLDGETWTEAHTQDEPLSSEEAVEIAINHSSTTGFKRVRFGFTTPFDTPTSEYTGVKEIRIWGISDAPVPTTGVVVDLKTYASQAWVAEYVTESATKAIAAFNAKLTTGGTANG